MDVRSFIKRNAPTILTYLGATGVVATTIMAVKETPKALSLLEDAKEKKGEKLSKWEIVKTAGPVYFPSVLTGIATITCIVGSNVINKKQQATLISAYALLDNSYREYKKKTDELYGEEAGRNIRSEIAKDKYTGDDEVLDDDKELFYDFYSGRYFESTEEHVRWAEYETNRALVVNGAVTINEFYDFLGLSPIDEYEPLGWSCGQMQEMYWHSWIEFEHEKTTIDCDSVLNEGMPCTIINIPLHPFVDYLEY